MTDAPNGTGMGVLVGAKATGARSGAYTHVVIGVKCVTPGLTNGVYPITVTFPTDNTTHNILYFDNSDGNHYYPLGSTTSGTFTASSTTDGIYNTAIKVTWARGTFEDTKYDTATCTRS